MIRHRPADTFLVDGAMVNTASHLRPPVLTLAALHYGFPLMTCTHITDPVPQSRFSHSTCPCARLPIHNGSIVSVQLCSTALASSSMLSIDYERSPAPKLAGSKNRRHHPGRITTTVQTQERRRPITCQPNTQIAYIHQKKPGVEIRARGHAACSALMTRQRATVASPWRPTIRRVSGFGALIIA